MSDENNSILLPLGVHLLKHVINQNALKMHRNRTFEILHHITSQRISYVLLQ